VRWLSRLVHDFRSVVARRREEREMEEELQAHLELLAEEKLGRGATPDEAWRAARVELGSVESVKEAVRDARFSRLAEDLWKDLGYAGRTLARAPGFTAVTVLTLALGIGATAAIFSVVHAVLIRPLPYADPGRLTLVWSDFTGMGARRAPASPFEFRETAIRSRSRSASAPRTSSTPWARGRCWATASSRSSRAVPRAEPSCSATACGRAASGDGRTSWDRPSASRAGARRWRA
jgi:hypothetical protein